MPNPTRSDVHVDRPLTNISIAYIQKTSNFIATQVFPNVPVDKQSDKYFTYTQADWFRSEAKLRAPGTESAGSGYRLGTASYFADVIAIHKDIDDQTRANADAPLNLERDSTQWVTQQLLLKREIDWAGTYFVTGVWTGSSTGTDLVGNSDFTRWDDVSSTPIDDITNEIVNIAKNTGYRPNVLVIGTSVWKALKNHPDVLDRIKYTQRGVITLEMLAGLFDVERVVVPWAVKNTGEEGETGTYSFIVSGTSALLVYAAPAPSLMVPSGGYTFSWTGLFGAGQQGNRIKNFRVDLLASDRIEGEMAYDLKLVAAGLGAFFSGATA